MDSRRIYEDITKRTGGDIYIGVVGPVRTGKSTFIKRFMETLVIPNIENVYRRERAKDELPQSGSGRTIMTAEPKFVPEEAVEIRLDGKASMKVRLIDCVGYMVNGALGQMENDAPRMVTTPWYDHEIPMSEAAEIGTRKVIAEHSTIGLVITTDGSITDLGREEYVKAEERVIRELQALDKPFMVVLNSTAPGSETAQALKRQLSEKYGVTCEAVNCLALDDAGIAAILKGVLYEFPVKELGIMLPVWASGLPAEHPIKETLFQNLLDSAGDMRRLRQVGPVVESMKSCKFVEDARIAKIDLGSGVAVAQFDMPQEIFYSLIEEQAGVKIKDEGDIIPLLHDLAMVKREYDRIDAALQQVRSVGYGIVMPTMEELTLEEPEIVRQGGRYGVRLRASAPSIHMIRADIQTEVSPVVGSEKQSEELVHYLLREFDGDPGRIWQSNIFGKSLHELVSEGLNNKLNRMPDEARAKLQETLQRIINEGSGGLICIIL